MVLLHLVRLVEVHRFCLPLQHGVVGVSELIEEPFLLLHLFTAALIICQTSLKESIELTEPDLDSLQGEAQLLYVLICDFLMV
mmetsp:Transcript_23606/g.27560  ORF Transcript_23606/g.27560 Transcript_23606/m.27560 type:complete len:83 (+) Transcript_23606:210-458(+)